MTQDKLTKLARGQECRIRLPMICNFNKETTVPCHYRLSGISGLGLKSPSLLIAFGCSDCHAYVDTHHDAETKAAFAEGVFRTQAWLIEQGAVKW